MNNIHKYDDIINLPHHVSERHPKMSLHDRAAQFASFAALTGHEDSVKETARLTKEKPILSESQIELLNINLRSLLDNGGEAEITFFVPDEKKNGGEIKSIIGVLKKADSVSGEIILEEGFKIPIIDILRVIPIEETEHIL